MTDQKRLELVARCASLVRSNIDAAGGVYDGRMVPNLQSVIDLATVDERHLIGVEKSLVALERARTSPEGT